MNKIQNLIIGFKKRVYKFQRIIESDPFKVAALWKKSGIQIGENTCIYHNVILSGDGKEPIIIGNNCILTGCTLLAHDASTNRYLGIEYGKPSITQPIIIEDNCFIGFGAIILMGVRIGHDSIIGAGAVVTHDIPPFSVAAGNPAKVICPLQELIDKRKQFL